MIENLASFNKLKEEISYFECFTFIMTDEDKNKLAEIKIVHISNQITNQHILGKTMANGY